MVLQTRLVLPLQVGGPTLMKVIEKVIGVRTLIHMTHILITAQQVQTLMVGATVTLGTMPLLITTCPTLSVLLNLQTNKVEECIA